MNCFGLARVVLSWLWVGSVAADSLGWVVADSFGWLGWLQVVSDGFGWFQMVSVGFDRFPVFSGYVFRIYETRKKFNYLIHTTSEKKSHNKRFVKFFHIVKIETENNFKTLYSPIDIAYDPVKHFKIKINCFFLTNKFLAYRSTYIVDKKGKKI